MLPDLHNYFSELGAKTMETVCANEFLVNSPISVKVILPDPILNFQRWSLKFNLNNLSVRECIWALESQ